MGARPAAFEKQPPRRFSREWFLNGLRTGGWVAVITLLVWVYADIHFTEGRSIRVTLRIHTDSTDNMVALNPTAPLALQLEVKGRRHAIEQFAGAKLSYDAAKELPPGLHAEVSIVELLEELPEVRKAGLEILSTRPKAVDIHLDTLETIAGVPVRFERSGGEATDIKFTPERVNLLVPTSRLSEINRQKLELPTETVDLRDRAVGEQLSKRVRVQVPEVLGCRLSPEVVDVTFTVGQQLGKPKEFTVTIRVQTPREWLTDDTWSQYKFEAQDPLVWTRKITVRGDRMDLEGLRPEEINAYIILTQDSKRQTEGWWPGKVHVQLPRGLKVQADPVDDVGYRLVKRSGGGP